MVIRGSTGQLLKCTKTVNIAAKFSIFNKWFINSKTNVSSNSVVFPRVNFSCNCRRFHYTEYFQNSRDTRTSFTKLSPQEKFGIRRKRGRVPVAGAGLLFVYISHGPVYKTLSKTGAF